MNKRKLALAAIVFFLCIVNCALAGWFPTNQSYQNLSKVRMLNATYGYAVGGEGYIVKTIDGGDTWQPLTLQNARTASGVIFSISDLSFVSVPTGYIVGNEGTIFKTIDAGKTWLQLTVNNAGGNITSVYFTSSDIGYISDANGKIFKTMNGGITWDLLTTGITTPITKILFMDANTGWFTGTGGIIKKTTDAGITWTSQTTSVTTNIISLNFVSASIGWFATYTGVYRTTDGGATWSAANTSLASINEIHFVSSFVGWLVCNDFSNTIRKTTDGGVTWSTVYSSTINLFTSVHFTTSSVGFAAGGYSQILKTTNGGTTWTIVNNYATQSNLYAVSFNTSTADGWMVGDLGVVLKSNNNGNAWTSQTSGTTALLTGVYAFSNTTAWFTGTTGVIKKTTDAGLTWTSQTSGVSSTLYDIKFNTASNGLCIGDGGKILKTTNGGTTWSPVTSGSSNALRCVVYASSSIVYVVGHGGVILKSTDGGATWATQTSGVTANLIGAYFTSATEGYACGVGGTILKTVNGGTTWSAQTTGTTKYFTKFVFTTATNGWAVGQDGIVAYTINGGTNWTVLTRTHTFQVINCVGMTNNGELVTGAQTGGIGKFSVSCPPAVPTNYNTTYNTIICNNTKATLFARGEGQLGWYSASTGGNYLGGGDSYTSPNLTASTTYFVQDSTCSASTRLAVTVTVTTPSIINNVDGSNCGPGKVSLFAQANTGLVNWFAASTGGVALGSGNTFTTPTLTTNTTYYAEAGSTSGCTSSSRTAVIANIVTPPTITSVQPADRCGTGVLTLTATPSAGNVNWFTTPTGGSTVFTGTSFITPSISATTDYYAEASNLGCTSARTLVKATVNAMPVVSSVVPGAKCGSGVLVLGAVTSTGTLEWYSAISGGTILFTGSSFTTPLLSATTTYYVQAVTSTCTSGRSAVTATINTQPDSTVTVVGYTLKSEQNGAQYQWVDCNGNNDISGATSQTFIPTQNGIYKVKVNLGTCNTISGCKTVSGVGIATSQVNNKMQIYPNPSSGVLYINTEVAGKFKIVNALGATLLEIDLKAGKNEVTGLENLSNGIYYLEGSIENSLVIKKFVVLK